MWSSERRSEQTEETPGSRGKSLGSLHSTNFHKRKKKNRLAVIKVAHRKVKRWYTRSTRRLVDVDAGALEELLKHSPARQWTPSMDTFSWCCLYHLYHSLCEDHTDQQPLLHLCKTDKCQWKAWFCKSLFQKGRSKCWRQHTDDLIKGLL